MSAEQGFDPKLAEWKAHSNGNGLEEADDVEVEAYYSKVLDEVEAEVRKLEQARVRNGLGNLPVAFMSSSAGAGRRLRRDAPKHIILVPDLRGRGLYRAARVPDHTDAAFENAAHHAFEYLPPEERVRALREFLNIPV